MWAIFKMRCCFGGPHLMGIASAWLGFGLVENDLSNSVRLLGHDRQTKQAPMRRSKAISATKLIEMSMRWQCLWQFWRERKQAQNQVTTCHLSRWSLPFDLPIFIFDFTECIQRELSSRSSSSLSTPLTLSSSSSPSPSPSSSSSFVLFAHFKPTTWFNRCC